MTTGSGAPGAGTGAKSLVSPLALSAACAGVAQTVAAATKVARVRAVRLIGRGGCTIPTLTVTIAVNARRVLGRGGFALVALPCRQPFVGAAGVDQLFVRS